DPLMRRITTAVGATLLTLVAASAQGKSLNPAGPLELKKWNIFVGNWALSGTAKDTPTGPAYKEDWSLHERWILGGLIPFEQKTRDLCLRRLCRLNPTVPRSFSDIQNFASKVRIFGGELRTRCSTVTSDSGSSLPWWPIIPREELDIAFHIRSAI